MVTIIDKTSKKALIKYSKSLNSYIKKVYRVLNIDNKYCFSIIICGNTMIKKLNKEYRNIDAVTDVLSFEDEDIYDDTLYLGEIFINYYRVLSQAKRYKHSIKREYIFLAVHGLLHLCGYDHIKKKDANLMEALQKEIVGNLK